MSRPLDSNYPLWDAQPDKKQGKPCAPSAPYPSFYSKPGTIGPSPSGRKSKPLPPNYPNYRPYDVPAVHNSYGHANPTAAYDPTNPHNLTQQEKDTGGGCLMALIAIVIALFAYVSDTTVSVEVHKKTPPKTIHKE